MKRIFLTLFFLLPLSMPLSIPAQASTSSTAVNGIAVVVNDEVITRQELNNRLLSVEQRAKSQGVTLPSPSELRKQVIERLIIERAQLQAAREQGLRVDDANLDRAMVRMAEQNKMTLQAFRDQLEREGMSYAQFREGVREDIMLQRLLEREVDSKVQVSEAEVDNYLAGQFADKMKAKAASGVQQAHVRHILIKISPTESKDQARYQLLEIKKQVESGTAKFDDLAKKYSGDATAEKGGDLGWVLPGDVPEFDPTISVLKDGQISDPIETPYGLHLIQVVERRADEVSPERERMTARAAIRARKVEEATADWARELRDRAYVEIRDQ